MFEVIVKMNAYRGGRDLHRSQSKFDVRKVNRRWVYNPYTMMEWLKKALHFFGLMCRKPVRILVISSSEDYRPLLSWFCKAINANYVQGKWMGGFLTNARSSRKKVDHYRKFNRDIMPLVEDSKSYEFTSLYEETDARFQGVKSMDALPELCIFLDVTKDGAGIRECHKLGIPCIAFVNTADCVKYISYPILGNNNSFFWVAYVLSLFLFVYLKAKKETSLSQMLVKGFVNIRSGLLLKSRADRRFYYYILKALKPHSCTINRALLLLIEKGWLARLDSSVRFRRYSVENLESLNKEDYYQLVVLGNVLAHSRTKSVLSGLDNYPSELFFPVASEESLGEIEEVLEDCLAEHEHYKAQTTKVKDHWNYLRLSFYNDLALEVKGSREASRSKGKKSSS